jgi:hypothetical protein
MVNGVSGSAQARDVSLAYLATCPDGSSGPIFISLPDAYLSVPADSQQWVPGDSFQGNSTAPDVCHGETYQAPAMLLQVGELFSDNGVDAVRVRVHLVDANANPSLTDVSWSPEQVVLVAAGTPIPTPSPSPTLTPSPVSTPSPSPTPMDTPTPFVTSSPVDTPTAVPLTAFSVAAPTADVPTVAIPTVAVPTVQVPPVVVPTILIPTVTVP